MKSDILLLILMMSTVAIASDMQTNNEKYSTITDFTNQDKENSSQNIEAEQEFIHADITTMLSKKSCGLIVKNFLCDLNQFKHEED